MAIKAKTPYDGYFHIPPFLLVSIFIVSITAILLAGCGGTSAKNTPEVTATPMGLAFEAHISEYLNPAWTSPPIEGVDGCWRDEDGGLDGYINGKLIIVSVDMRHLLFQEYFVSTSNDPNTPGPPEWGLPWADTPEDVGTVVLLWTIKEEILKYTDGSKGYRQDWGVRLVDFQKKAVVGEGYIMGPYLDRGSKLGELPRADLMASLRARLFAAPFQAHINEYLDPAWTSPPIEWRDHHGGYINGKLIVVSADTRQLLRPTDLKKPYSQPDEPGSPDWGLAWADTPEEVGTVVLVWTIRDEEKQYTDGSKGYREDFMVKLVDFQTKQVIGEDYYVGGLLPLSKYCTGDVISRSPWSNMMEGLRALPVHTTPASSRTPLVESASGDCAKAVRSRLAVGIKARVMRNLNFRSSPDLKNNLIRVHPIGTQLEVTGGPICTPYENGAYLWWKVRSENGEFGWVVEGTLDGTSYFLEPLE